MCRKDVLHVQCMLYIDGTVCELAFDLPQNKSVS